MTVTINHTWYTNFGNGTTTGYYAVGKWTAGATVVAGQLLRQNATPVVNNERVFVCIIAGTSAAVTEPTWVVTKGAKTVDGSATWMECTGQAAVNGDVVNTPGSSQNRSGSQVLGSIIANNADTYYFICTTAGTAGSGEPTYVLTAGSTTTDSGCTWTCIGTVGSFAAWAAPMARMGLAATWMVAGDTQYVSIAHTETITGSITMTWPGTNILPSYVTCVSNTSYNPPASSDITSGASYTTQLTSTVRGFVVITGLTIASSTSSILTICDVSLVAMRFKNCNFVTTSSIQIGPGSGNAFVEWYDCTIVSALGPSITLNGGTSFVWRGGGYTGTVANPTPISLSGGSRILCEGVDLSLISGNLMAYIGQQAVFLGCKLPPIITIPQSNGYHVTSADFVNCDNGNGTFRHERWGNDGNHVIDTVAVKTSGASDATTALSWKIVLPSYTSWLFPFECMPITIWNSTTGSNVDVTLQGAYNGATFPFNDGIWMDVRYYGSTTSPLLSTVSGTKANVLATHTQYSASTAAWDSMATTRLNNTAYVVGNLFRLTTNPDQLFICTTAGTTTSSQPSAYTSVADGTMVTDGTAVFRPLVRFSMTVTLTSPQPQIAGYIRAYVRAALPSSTFWIDPLLVIS